MKVIKENSDTIMKWANMIFLFLFSLHLFGFPDKYIIMWCIFAMVVFYVQNQKICLDSMFWFLGLAIILNGAGTFYYLRESLGYGLANILKMVIPTILVYPWMKQLAWNRDDQGIEKILLAIVLGTCLYSILNFCSFWEGGSVFVEGERRSWPDFWTRYSWAATHHSYWGCFIAGLSGYGIYLFSEKKWWKGILVLVLIAIENYIQIAVNNRMVLCVTAVSLAVSFLLFLYLNRKDRTKIIKIMIAALIIVAMAVFALAVNLFDIRSGSYYQSFVTRDGGILRNNRFRMIYEAILLLPSHWKGGATMWAAGNYWVHNYWLQVANVSGIFPFIFWMIVNVSAVIDVVRIIRSTGISQRLKYLLIPLLSSVVGYFMMEPGGTESNRYIIFYVMLIALVKQVANNVSDRKEQG